jgi:uncharacterized membrane protein
MSALLYGAISAKREAADAGTSKTASPGVNTYIDALAALVPAEVLGLHAVILSFCTKKSESLKSAAGTPITEITEPTTLKWAFWALLALAPFLFIAGRWTAKAANVKSPNKLLTLVQALIPAAAFVGWTMLQKTSAFDALDPGLATGARDTIAVISAVVLGVVAAALGYKLDKASPKT